MCYQGHKRIKNRGVSGLFDVRALSYSCFVYLFSNTLCRVPIMCAQLLKLRVMLRIWSSCISYWNQFVRK